MRAERRSLLEQLARKDAERNELRAEVERLRAIAKAFSEMTWERDSIAAEVCPRVNETVLAAVKRVVYAELQARNRAERAEAALKAEKVNCPWMPRALKAEAALLEIEQATEGIPEQRIPEQNCMLANRIARLALRGDTAPAEEKRGYAPTDALGDARAEAAEPRCVRCGSRYSPGGACSRRAEGCQGGRGEWTTFFPPAEEPKP